MVSSITCPPSCQLINCTRLVNQRAPVCLSLPHQLLGYRCMPPGPVFTWVLEIQMQVLMPAHPVFYLRAAAQLCYLQKYLFNLFEHYFLVQNFLRTGLMEPKLYLNSLVARPGLVPLHPPPRPAQVPNPVPELLRLFTFHNQLTWCPRRVNSGIMCKPLI